MTEAKKTTAKPKKTIIGAFLEAQKAMGAATKKALSHHGHYADLSMCIAVIKPALNDNGLVFTQPLGIDITLNAAPIHYLDTIIYHADSGESMDLGRAIIYCQRPNDPQAYGTGITYAKRYGLCAAFGLPTEDDDGNAASTPPKRMPTKATMNGRVDPNCQPKRLPKPTPKAIAEWQQFVMAVEADMNDSDIPFNPDKLPGWLWSKYGNGKIKLPVKPSDIDPIINEMLKIKHGLVEIEKMEEKE